MINFRLAFSKANCHQRKEYDDAAKYYGHVEKAKDSDSERHTHLFDILQLLHGDLPNARPVLDFSSVIDEFGGWTWDVDFFVLTGHN